MARAASLTIASSIALRLQCLAPRVHALGVKPLFELMCELSVGSSAAMAAFETYGALPADFIHAHGGHDLTPNFRVIK